MPSVIQTTAVSVKFTDAELMAMIRERAEEALKAHGIVKYDHLDVYMSRSWDGAKGRDTFSPDVRVRMEPKSDG